ncbi:MAG: hypothetical protein KC619_14200 [Myxococcales bacterium]|nr:hypothetical protein [Myxococcales bacterium]
MDGSADDGGVICACEAPPECQVVGCLDGVCQPPVPADDWAACGPAGERSCVDGACSYDVCGDRYREPGPDPAREACDDGNGATGDACSPDCTPTVLVIDSQPEQQALPATVSVAADDAGRLLFVWTATTTPSVGEPQLELLARRYNAAGVDQDMGAHLTLDGSLGIGWDPHAAVVGLANGWAVVWAAQDGDSSEAGIRYVVIPPTGAAPTSRRANQYQLGRQAAPAAARTTTGFLLAWADESGTVTIPGDSRLRMRSFDPTGRALADEAALSPDGTSARGLALASDGDRVLALWSQDPAPPLLRPILVGQRLGGAGPDASPFTISDVDGAEPNAAVLATGDFAVAFVSRDADPRGDIHARLVHATGDPLTGTTEDALTFTPPMGTNVEETAPQVLPLEAGYLVVYEDGGDSTATPPRARGVLSVQVGAATLPPELPTLAAYLQEGLQADVTLLRTSRGSWFAWSDAGSLGVAGAHRSFVAYLLPPP